MFVEEAMASMAPAPGSMCPIINSFVLSRGSCKVRVVNVRVRHKGRAGLTEIKAADEGGAIVTANDRGKRDARYAAIP